MTRNAAIIRITDVFILEWLDFEGGEIHTVRKAVDCLNDIEFTIEHPDLPEVREGESLQTVVPAYRVGRFLKRVDPPKGSNTPKD